MRLAGLWKVADARGSQAIAKAYIEFLYSPEGQEIRQAVRAPIQNRRPVGYRRDFLDHYRPNVTYYLPAETRRRTAALTSRSA